MMRFSRRLGLAASAMALAPLAAVGVCATAAAGAATGPTVQLAQPTLVSYQTTADTGYTYWTATLKFHWTVTAPSGVCSQKVTYADYDTIGGSIDPVLKEPGATVGVAKTARSFSVAANAYDYGRAGYGAVVRVTDCKGRSVASNPIHSIITTGQDTDPAITYSSGWSISHCACFSAGTTHWTTVNGASLTFRTAKPLDASGVNLALIMAKAPNRGSAAIYIDGVKRATVNTYSMTKVNRAVVYQIDLPGKTTHTVKIVNLATAGHPRIDLDATVNGG